MQSIRILLVLGLCGAVWSQTTSATFGSVIPFGGTPSDVVLDEARGRLYLVNASANRVDIYDYVNQAKLTSIPVGTRPLAAALSMDGKYLYVTNNGSSTVGVIDAGSTSLVQTVAVPAAPEGVEVGVDGRALVTTQGSGTGNTNNTLLIFDRTQPVGQQVVGVSFPPPPVTPTGVPTITARPTTTFRGKLLRTPDGNFIVGVSVINNSTQTVTYVYEVSSGTVLRSRTVTGQSTTLSMSPDGSRFMAGSTLYDTSTLAVLAQFNTANAPFSIGAINTTTNLGGSVFTPDGATIYGAFNVAPIVIPAATPQASTLLISDARNLGIQLGIKLPESIVAKMVMTQDGTNAWAASQSGLMYLPLSTLYNYPIIMPAANNVFLAQDPCNPGLVTAKLKINNIGQGTLTYSVPDPGSALEARAESGMAPSNIVFTMDPGRSGVVRQAGTNLYTGAATNSGTPVAVNIQSPQAINVPNTILVYMNYRQADQRGVIYPVAVGTTTTEGLQDILLDSSRQKIYLTNSAYNRIEVFDLQAMQFTTPIVVGQLPHTMAMGLDGTTLYVGNTGGESISAVNLDTAVVTSAATFPPVPRSGAASPSHPVAMAMGQTGLQFLMATANTTGTLASQWELINGNAILRQPDTIAVNPSSTTTNTLPGPMQMIATPDGANVLTMNGSGTVYLFDGINDAYTASAQLFSAPIQGYYGPVAAGPTGSYFLANADILSSTITQTTATAGTRNIAAVAAIDGNTFVRLTTPQRTAITVATRDDSRTLLELWDLQGGGSTLVGATAENPYTEVFGTTRVNLPPHQMVTDSNGTVYAITISGLSVIPTALASAGTQPQLATSQTIVNANTGSTAVKPGDFITINGTNLGTPATASQLPVPTVLGGSCVLFNNVAIPLLQTSSGQISAQIPSTVSSGINVVEVKSLAMGQASNPITVTLAKP